MVRNIITNITSSSNSSNLNHSINSSHNVILGNNSNHNNHYSHYNNNHNSTHGNTNNNHQHPVLKLDPDAVRRRASSISGCMEIPIAPTPAITSTTSTSSLYSVSSSHHHSLSHTKINKKSPTTKPFGVGGKMLSPSKTNNSLTSQHLGTGTSLGSTYLTTTVSFLVGITNLTGSASGFRNPGNSATITNKTGTSNNDSSDTLARVTIYCDTGTIATARILNGKVRHTFRRNVTSLDVVERCLKFPAPSTKIDWQLVSMSDSSGPSTSFPAVSTAMSTATADFKSKSLVQKNLELCDVGLAILQTEREKLVGHHSTLTNNSKATNVPTSSSTPATINPATPTTTTAIADSASCSSLAVQAPVMISTLGTNTGASTATSGSNAASNVSFPAATTPTALVGNTASCGVGPAPTSGMEFQFSLAERPMKHVDQCLTDIQKMNKIVHAVSTNGIGTVFLYGNGGVAYTPNIPRTLYQKLSQLRYSKVHSSRPQYVSLGSRERYFVAFHDGTVSYKGPKGLDKELRKLTSPSGSTATTITSNSNSTHTSHSHHIPTHTGMSGTAIGTGHSNNNHNINAQNIITKQISSASSFISSKISEAQSHQPSQHQQQLLWPLRSVAFGVSYDTFCIVFQDGTYKYQGKTFPKELEDALLKLTSKQQRGYCSNSDDELQDILESTEATPTTTPTSNSSPRHKLLSGVTKRKKMTFDSDEDDYPLQHYYNKKKADEREKDVNHPSLTSVTKATINNKKISLPGKPGGGIMCITLGPSGEWFVRAEDGRMEWGGISEEMDEAIQQLLDDGHRLNYFDFGEDLSYFVSYD